MPTPNNKMNNQYEEAREWYDANWPYCTQLDIDWTCRRYEYPNYTRTYKYKNLLRSLTYFLFDFLFLLACFAAM